MSRKNMFDYKKYQHEYYLNHKIENKEKQKLYQKTRYPIYKTHLINYQKHQQRKLRMMALNSYGGKCACCGETTYEFLAIDHINGGGNRHRKKQGKNIYRWLKKMNYPPGFRVLCHNCNNANGYYGFCPHKLI